MGNASQWNSKAFFMPPREPDKSGRFRRRVREYLRSGLGEVGSHSCGDGDTTISKDRRYFLGRLKMDRETRVSLRAEVPKDEGQLVRWYGKRRRLTPWVVYQALLPLAPTAVFVLVGFIMKQRGVDLGWHASVLGTGELFLYGALLLLTTFVEMDDAEHLMARYLGNDSVLSAKHLVVLLALLLLACSLVYRVMVLSGSLAEDTRVVLASTCSDLSVASAACSGILSIGSIAYTRRRLVRSGLAQL